MNANKPLAGNVLPLPGASSAHQQLAHFIRLGETGHRIVEALLAENRFPARRVVVDASRYHQQRELVDALRAADIEIVLDTKCAELAAQAMYQGYARGAPWSAIAGDKPLDESYFSKKSRGQVIQQIEIVANMDMV